MIKSTDIYFPNGEIEKIFIKSIWRLREYNSDQRKEIILPKGTVEIIFNFSDGINYINPSLQISKKLPVVFINGINFRPFQLIKTGRQEFLGIQLNGIGLRLLFNLSAKELNDNVFKGDEICSSLNILADELYHKPLFSQQVETILAWIRKRIPTMNYSISRAHSLLSLNDSHHLTVKEISEKICLSERQLRRFSQDWLGMNTEEFILYNKYLHCLNRLHHRAEPLTAIGLEAGYYDQSHFIREFKSYTGITPRQYREATTGLPGHIFV